MVDVDTQQLPEQGAAILSVAVRIPAAPTVTHADVQHSVGAEDDVASVVVGVGLVDLEDQLAMGRVGQIRIGSHAPPLDSRVTRAVGVVQEERAVVAIAGWKASPSSPCSFPLDTSLERSRNGRSSSLPP